MLANLASTVVKVGEAAAVAGAIVAGVSVKMAADFQASTTRLQTQAHMSAQSVDEVRQGLLKMATEVGKSPTELSDGFYHIASALTQLPPELRNVNDELKIYRNAVELSKIGNASLEDSTQAVVGVLAAFGKEGMTAAQAAAELNAIVGAGDMRMQQLTAAMATGILPAASTFGLTLKDVGAALATLTDNVTPADEAATRLRMTFSLLGAPSHEAQKALAAIGINATELGYDMRKPNGLLVALGDLRSHLSHIDVSQLQGGLDTAKKDLSDFGFTTDQVDKMVGKLGPDATEQAVILSKAFGGGRTSAAIMTLLTEFDAFKEKYQAIDEGSKKFGEDWQATLNTFSSQVDRLKAGAEVLAIRLGDRLLPALTSVVKFLADNMGVLEGWGSGLERMAGGVQNFLSSIGIGAPSPQTPQAFRAGERGETGGQSAAVARSPGEMFRSGERGEMGSSGVTSEAASAMAGKRVAEWAKQIAQALADAFVAAVRSIDWAELGRAVAVNATAFIGSFLDNLGWAGEVTKALAGAFVTLKAIMVVGWVLEFAGAFRVVAAEEGTAIAVTRVLGAEYLATGAKAVAGAAAAVVAWAAARVETAIIAGMYAWDWIVANAKVVAAFLATSARAIASFIAIKVQAAIQAAQTALAWVVAAVRAGAEWVATSLKAIGSFIATKVSAVVNAAQTSLAWVVAHAAMLAATMRTVGGMILMNVWAGIVKVATLAWTVAQWLLNAALAANPIGLVIIVIALLVAGIIWAYQNVGWFRDAVNKAWKLLQEFGGWVKDVLWPIIVSLADKFAETAGRMVESAKSIARGLIDHIGGGLNAAIGLFRGFIEAINGILGHFGIEGIKVEGTLKTGIDLGAVKKAVGLATGGMMTNGPYLVGEGDPAHPEYVIPTDPKYRPRAKSLLQRAVQAVGLAAGGVMGGGRSDPPPGAQWPDSPSSPYYGWFLNLPNGDTLGYNYRVSDPHDTVGWFYNNNQSPPADIHATPGFTRNADGSLSPTWDNPWLPPEDRPPRPIPPTGILMSKGPGGYLDYFVGKGLAGGGIMRFLGLAEGGTIPTSGSDGECVEFVEEATGIHYAVSAAKEMVRYINSDVGRAGELAVFTAGPFGHVALLTGDETGGSFPVVDSNWVGHHEIGTHVMNRSMYGWAGFIDTGKPLGTLAGGTGGGGFNPLGLIDGAVKAAQGALGNVPEWIRGLTGAVLGKMVDGVKSKLATSFAGALTGANATSGTHADWLHAAEKIAGVGPDWDQGLSIIIDHESGWRPDAANLNDSNAAAGNPSRGLMQLTGSNRARYDPDESPVGQIVGGIRYILARYGGIGNVPGVRSVLSGGSYVPYDSGGLLPPGLTLAYNGTGRSEVVSPAGAGGMAELVAEQRRTNALLHAILHDQNAPAGGYAAALRAG